MAFVGLYSGCRLFRYQRYFGLPFQPRFPGFIVQGKNRSILRGFAQTAIFFRCGKRRTAGQERFDGFGFQPLEQAEVYAAGVPELTVFTHQHGIFFHDADKDINGLGRI